jgi:phosphoserine phosphatase
MSEPRALAYACVIVAAPGSGQIDATVLARARSALGDVTVTDDRPLADREAHEVLFTADDTVDITATRAAVAHVCRDRPIDVHVIPDDSALRRKRLLVADMESTIIEQEMLDELGDMIGARAHIEAITARAMRGELDFETALTERVGLLAGLDARVLDEVARRITDMPGARSLVATMHANGAYTALVSGGFTVFTGPVAARLGFDEHRANTLDIASAKIAGTVAKPILGRAAKLAALEDLARQKGLQLAETMAVGDGANDLAMLKVAGLGVAFRAKPIVAAEAAASVVHGDLTSLLYLQGYRRSEFIA